MKIERRSASVAFLFLVVTVVCILPSVAGAQSLTKTIIVDCWHDSSGGCAMPSGFSTALTTDYLGYNYPTGGSVSCSFPGSISPLATVTGITVTVSSRRTGLQNQVYPDIGVRINNQTVGTTQSIATSCCSCSIGFKTFAYASGAYPDGFPGYLNTGNNLLTLDIFNDVWIEEARVEITYEYPPPMSFDVSNATPEIDRRVLISKHRNDDSGYHYYQALLGQDARFPVRATISDGNGNPISNQTVYFRVEDPPDTSLHVPANLKSANDNADIPAGTLTGAVVQPLGNRRYSAVTGTSGEVELVLEVTRSAAGDNYHIEGSFDEAFSCAPNCARTGTITAWKRVYVEADRMFRKGAYLAATATPGTTVIKVTDAAPFTTGTIRLIHAPRFDGTGQPGYYYDDVQVTKVNKTKKELTLLAPGIPQNRTYYGPEFFDGTLRPFLADAVAKITGSEASDYHSPNTDYLAGLFSEAFVEKVLLPSGGDPVPYLPYEAIVDGSMETDQNSEKRLLAEKWFANAIRGNHQHLLAGSREFDLQTMGRATSRIGTNMAWIWVDPINANAPLLNNGQWKFNGEVTAHEIGHLWQVNSIVYGPTFGHCGNLGQYADPSKFCTMHANPKDPSCGGGGTCPEFYDGQVMFHFNGFGDSEYIWIRRLADPFPEN